MRQSDLCSLERSWYECIVQLGEIERSVPEGSQQTNGALFKNQVGTFVPK
jgi:hypothetical protein